MTRTQRLLDLLQNLRRRRYPVSGTILARESGISLRTLYRDIATLQAQGADIRGEAGMGYVLKPGFTLPPLMFSPEEIEALALGARWVTERADGQLAFAALEALAKIGAVLPPELRNELDASSLLIGPGEYAAIHDDSLAEIRQAIREERKLDMTYADANGQATTRTLWPFALAYFDRASVIVAWCELRQAFRHFRTDRIITLQPSKERYPRGRRALLREWRKQEGIDE